MPVTKDGFVLDCSITIAWCFDDEASLYTDGVRDQLAAMRAVVPSLWSVEVANVLLIGERRQRLDQARSLRFVSLIGALPIVVDDETTLRAFAETTHLARTYHLSVYAAAYLELAIRRGLPLASLDGKLRAAAQGSGVALFDPT